jgi:hypothetical protein
VFLNATLERNPSLIQTGWPFTAVGFRPTAFVDLTVTANAACRPAALRTVVALFHHQADWVQPC